MPLPDFNLDDRTFQDLVDECKRLIPKYCPEWTDHNLSDPGITLIELFAWMTEQIIFRLNKVPQKNYVRFLEMVGGRLMTATAAKADVTFTLSAAQENPVTVPVGSEVSTVRTETEEALVFATEEELTVVPPTLSACLTSSGDEAFADRSRALRDPDHQFEIFDEKPRPGNALYLGFKEDLSRHKLAISLEAKIEGIGVDPRRPPLRWQAWSGQKEAWLDCAVESDGTGGFNRSGEVVLHVPRQCALRELDGKVAFWVRCLCIEPEKNKRPYSASPRVNGLRCYSMGGTATASHGLRVRGEVLGTSDGRPGQTFRLQSTPVLSRTWEEVVEVVSPGGAAEKWTEVEDFSRSGPDDPHFTLDSVSGEVGFGPNIRQPDGRRRQYGRLPAGGSTIRMAAYRWGGGIAGNVGSGTLVVLKSSLPLIDSATNRAAAAGGADPEGLEHAMLRIPRLLKTTSRAVTAEDYEFLAKQASPAVARAHCIQPKAGGDGSAVGPGLVHVYIVPALPEGDHRVSPEMLALSPHVQEAVHAFLDERRLLTTMLHLSAPDYLLVSIELTVKALPGSAPQAVKQQVEGALYRYLHPLSGGPHGQGWPFGRELFLPEVYALVQRVAEVDYIEEIKLYRQGAEGREGPFERISFPPGSLPCSVDHLVVVK